MGTQREDDGKLPEIRSEHIVRSPFKIQIPTCDLHTFLTAAFKRLPNKKALIELETAVSLTYSQLDDATERIAGFLYHDLAVRPRDLVALFSPNCILYPVVMISILRLGATVVTINAMSTADELVHYLGTTRPKLLLAHSSRIEVARRTCADMNIRIFSIDSNVDSISLQSVIEDKATYERAPEVSTFSLDPSRDVALVNFSSGTSGLPKAVMNSHRSMIAVTCGFEHPVFHSKTDYFLVYQPLSHIFGLGVTTHGLSQGLTVVVMKQFNVDRYLKAVQDYQISRVHMVPAVAMALTKSGLNRKYNLGHVTVAVVASSPFGENGEAEIRDFFQNPSLTVNQAYGLSESAGLITHGASDLSEASRLIPGLKPDPPGSVGLLYPENEVVIVDLEKGQSVGPNEKGEIWARSPMIMLGYLNNEAATRETIVRDAWLRTGDVGYYNEDGHFFIVGRLKELIKYKSYQVAPAELEALLLSHPSVADVGVIGLPDEEAGELPQAWIVKKPGHEGLTEQQIIDFVKEKSAPYKWLRGGVKFVTSIPRNPTGKILRRLMVSSNARPKAKL